jgi:altronate dehydratase large subunit
MSIPTFEGYVRPNGRAGVRNHVLVLSIMDNANPTARRIGALVPGATVITPSFGRGQLGYDAKMTARALVGLATNPNVHSTLVVSLEPVSAALVADEIRVAGRPVGTVTVMEDGGSLEASLKGARWIAGQLAAASREKRQPMPISELVLGVECGGSDATSGIAANPVLGAVADRLVDAGGAVVLSETSEWLGGEALLARRARDPAIGERIIAAVARIEADAVARGVDLRGQQPSYDNMKGGLTTIEEKTLGAILKGGTRPITGFLEYAQRPPSSGLHLMDTFAAAVESMTALSAGGCQLILFATGQGNPAGDQIAPTIKVCGNPDTIRDLHDHIDVDVSAVTRGATPIEAAGEDLMRFTLEVAEGGLTRCEIFAEGDTTISRFERSI